MKSPFDLPDPNYRIYPIRGPVGYFHLLHDVAKREAVLVDAGFTGEMPRLERTLKKAGLGWGDVQAVLLTHGHLDHTRHLGHIKQLSGAPVCAHPMEQAHINGAFPYRGPSRVCGALEACGRRLLRYRPVAIDHPLQPDMELPYWGGLRVIHLPGHTQGHCGFFSARFNLLFSGDLFASYVLFAHLPPNILNSCPEYLASSLNRVKELSPSRIVPNHYFAFNGELHRREFDRLVARRRTAKSFTADQRG
jgi:glyoxylase-like metal-dependent hydrolase (beta-lactamase superfamily II)